MSKFEKTPTDAFKSMTFGAGILVSDFDPETGTVALENILYVTKNGHALNVTRELIDIGEPIDNVPEGTKQLQKAKPFQITGNTTVVTFKPEAIMNAIASADKETFAVTGTKLKLRNNILESDFQDFWIITNYSEFNGEKNGGMCAYHIMNAMSIDGFNPVHKKDENGEFPFNYKAFYDINNIDQVPFEVYIKAGTAEAIGG